MGMEGWREKDICSVPVKNKERGGNGGVDIFGLSCPLPSPPPLFPNQTWPVEWTTARFLMLTCPKKTLALHAILGHNTLFSYYVSPVRYMNGNQQTVGETWQNAEG